MPPEQVEFGVHNVAPRRANVRGRDTEGIASMQLQLTPYGYCHCGCGQKANIAPDTDRAKGYIKGQPMRYLQGHRHISRAPLYLVDEETGCWNWARYVTDKGYGKHGHGFAHRFIYERERGPIPPRMVIDHLCRNTRCVNPDHLEVVTNAENTRRGNRAKLTREQVDEIRVRGTAGEQRAALAREFGVSRRCVLHIVQGTNWVVP